jgi:hypothetical protein
VLRPLIQRSHSCQTADRERGVTMALVAVSMVAIISMAAISIDLGSLYEAKAEAQRAADMGALAAARFLSIQGITGDPTNASGSWTLICDGIGSPASLAAISVAQQNFVNGAAPPTVMVYYGTGAGVPTNQSCLSAGPNFGINPVVQVYVQQPTLPTYFARIFSLLIPGAGGNSGVSATAVAEVFNSSGSGALASGMVPVQPRCVKPWILPNVDPGNGSQPFVKPDGTIVNQGVLQLPPGTGVIGETFTINADCTAGAPNCEITPTKNILDNPPIYNGATKILEYVPSLIPTALTPVAVASNSNCSLSNSYQSVIAGCDQTTAYTCGAVNGSTVDLTENPLNPAGSTGDSPAGASCLINQGGADTLAGYPSPIAYPFQIAPGVGNPLFQAGAVNNNGDTITVSNSIVTLPIVTFPAPLAINQPTVTIVGFLQVFIDGINADGSMPVTVMNVAGCSTAPTNAPIFGTSPVPIRLITPP